MIRDLRKAACRSTVNDFHGRWTAMSTWFDRCCCWEVVQFPDLHKPPTTAFLERLSRLKLYIGLWPVLLLMFERLGCFHLPIGSGTRNETDFHPQSEKYGNGEDRPCFVAEIVEKSMSAYMEDFTVRSRTPECINPGDKAQNGRTTMNATFSVLAWTS